jgi:hypothetical protein
MGVRLTFICTARSRGQMNPKQLAKSSPTPILYLCELRFDSLFTILGNLVRLIGWSATTLPLNTMVNTLSAGTVLSFRACELKILHIIHESYIRKIIKLVHNIACRFRIVL